MSDRAISFVDYTIINLDGVSIPLFYGTIAYRTSVWYHWSPITATAAFFVVECGDFGKIAVRHQDLFEFVMQKVDISVFLVRDLKRLDSYLGRERTLNSAHIN